MAIVGDSALSGSASSLLVGTVPQEGLVIGRHYTLHQRIGAGGMATVHIGWLVAAADFARVVAIKRLHPRLAFDEHYVTRFRDEARLNACLSHPNIAQVFDVVEQNRELLIIMEYVHGVPLDGLVKDAEASQFRLPLTVVSGVLVPALHALHALHEATDDRGRYIGTVHRDFSPPNIMVTSEGHSKLIDLGVAKARTDEHVTSPGKLAGKLGYCSPEQIRTGAVDRRTDVFAAGIVLWEMLTGKHLFHLGGNNAETVRRVLEQEIPRPSSFNSEVPGRLDELVLHAMERSPERRFASARELALALEAAIVPARPSEIADWLGKVCGRRMARLARRVERTRRCMARSRLGTAPAESSTQEVTVRHAMAAPTKVGAAKIVGSKPGWRERHRTKALARKALWVTLAAGGMVGLHLLSRSPAPLTQPGPAPSVGQVRRTAPDVVLLPSPPTEPDSPREVSSAATVMAESSEAKAIEAPSRARVRSGRSPALASKPRMPRRFGPSASVVPQVVSQPDCDPPIYVDADGIRHFKLECL